MILAARYDLGSLSLPAETRQILELTSEHTAKGFEFREQKFDLTDTWASVKVARGDAPNHLILYHPDHRTKLGYLIAHECGHILRLHEVPLEYKKLPATGPPHRRCMVEEVADDLYRLTARGLSAAQLGQLTAIWHEGLIRQLGNVPVDLRIERWLYESYEGLRPLQRQALLGQLKENATVLRREVKEFTPSKVYEANLVINAAFARYMTRLLGGYDRSLRYAESRLYTLARQLADDAWNSPDRGYEGDVETIERWSHHLELDSWWEWEQI